MEYLMNNWQPILGIILIIAAVVFTIIYFVRLAPLEKRKRIKAWMEWAVTEAEKELGHKTGQAKLRNVWDRFSKSKFGWLTYIISFEQFMSWIDGSVKWLDEQLKTNENLYKYVYGITRAEEEAQEQLKNEVAHDE